MVAKSYQELEQLTEPYVINDKAYIKVKLKSGATKQVRWYSEKEYNKMYPTSITIKATAANARTEVVKMPEGEKIINSQYARENDWILKSSLGFGENENAYIYILSGYKDEAHKDYFFSRKTKRNGWFGWYYAYNDTLPVDLPFGIQLVKIKWEDVGNPDGTLKPTRQIHKVIDKYIYGESTSEYFGAIGARYDLKLKVTRAMHVENQYGGNMFHTMEDENGNVFLWNTSSKSLEENSWYTMRGTVKDYNEFQGTKQTVLTRCMSIQKIEK